MKPLLLRYRVPHSMGIPPIGGVIMGEGPRVRRAYRILSVAKVQSRTPHLDCVHYRIAAESMSAERGRQEVVAGCPRWTIVWDRRKRG